MSGLWRSVLIMGTTRLVTRRARTLALGEGGGCIEAKPLYGWRIPRASPNLLSDTLLPPSR
jgi:hypothetical protein